MDESVLRENSTAFDELKADLAALRSDMTALRDDALALGKNGARSAASVVGDQVDHLAHRAKNVVKGAASSVELKTEDLRVTISQNPLMAVGAAIAIGYALGKGMLRS